MNPIVDFSLADRVALVTGGAGLLGVRHAEAIAAAGGTPVLVDIRGDAAELQAKELASRFAVPATAFACDVTQADAIKELVRAVLARYGRLDILVNNAANNPKVEAPGRSFMRLEQFPIEQWNADIAVGLTGPFLCARIIGEVFAARRRGVIINISSEYGIIAPDQRLYYEQGVAPDEQPVKPVSYSVVKAGLHGLTLYLSPTGLTRACASIPSLLAVSRAANRRRSWSARPRAFRWAAWRNRTISRARSWYLCSDAASFVTGANLVVDGGKTRVVTAHHRALVTLLDQDPAALRVSERGEFDRRFPGRSIVLMGAGGLGRRTLHGLRQHGIEPLAFADNNPRQQGSIVDGVRVLAPGAAAREFSRECGLCRDDLGRQQPASVCALATTARRSGL